jgi:uncharacterized membrane protein
MQQIVKPCMYMKTVTSYISSQAIPATDSVKAADLREPIYYLIKQDLPGFNKDCYISQSELNQYRNLYLHRLIAQEGGELGDLEQKVLGNYLHDKILSQNIEEDIGQKLTLGQRLADRIADFGGSWRFIILFFAFLSLWMGANAWLLRTNAFDPYPFILLNLILSSLAALQAPIIMMSQNRQEQKDRIRSEHDYKIDLKAELEIKLLHEKLDHLMINQNKKLFEIQQIQADFLEDILSRLKPG